MLILTFPSSSRVLWSSHCCSWLPPSQSQSPCAGSSTGSASPSHSSSPRCSSEITVRLWLRAGGMSLSGSRGLTASLVTYSFDPCFLLWVSRDWGGYLRNWWQVLDIYRDYITIWAITKLAEAFRFFNWSPRRCGCNVECRVNSSKYPQFLTVLTREFNLKICYRSNLRDFHVNTNYTEQRQRQSCLLNTDTCWNWSWHLTIW